MTWRTSWARLFERARASPLRSGDRRRRELGLGSSSPPLAPPARSDSARPQRPKDGRNRARRQNYSHRLSQNLKTET
jgi:hypothetical protein